MPLITRLEIHDIRFPTSRDLDGSDAMNPDPDYSSAYVVLLLADGQRGYGSTFTIGRGNEVVCAAIRAHEHLVVGRQFEDFIAAPGAFWRSLNGDSQLRWLGPDKGVIHLALAAIVNALWDLYARHRGKPLWQLVSEFTPQQFVDCVDFRYLTDALTPSKLSISCSLRPQAKASASHGSAPRATRPTPPAPAGSGIRTTKSAASAGKPSPKVGPTSRSKSDAISRMISVGSESSAKNSAGIGA